MFNFLKQEIMKKLLLLAPIAALALASCSNDEQIAQSPALNAQEVTFRPAVNGTTRTITTDANFTQFIVKATITNSGDGYAFWKGQGTNIRGSFLSFDQDTADTGVYDVEHQCPFHVLLTDDSCEWENVVYGHIIEVGC